MCIGKGITDVLFFNLYLYFQQNFKSISNNPFQIVFFHLLMNPEMSVTNYFKNFAIGMRINLINII